MTVHIVSVGVSIIEAFERPAGKLGEAHHDLIDAIGSAWPQHVFAGLADAAAVSGRLDQWFGTDGDLAGAADFAVKARQIEPARWPPLISAELATLARDRGSFALAPDDIAVLLTSDTRRGLTAALWNAVALAGGDLRRVRYLADPAAPLGEPAKVRGHALIVRVPGLDARDAGGFRDAMGGLGHLGRHLLSSGEAGCDPGNPPITEETEEFRVYLSGGFKAAIPYLIGLAEGLRSLHTRGGVAALVLHDSADDDGSVIPLPLRRLPPAVVRHELSGFGPRGRPATQISHPSLLGYAYDDAPGGRYELTSFGAGLLAMFGLPEEPL
jgi:hypothetical protein